MKKIPKSDISIRPFKVYKSYTATNADSGSGYNRYLAENKYATADALSEGDLFLHSMWHQIHRMYYDQIYNPLRTYGREIADYVTDTRSYGKKALQSKCVVFTIPQNHYGEEIKPKSIILTDVDSLETESPRLFKDDGYGNILSNKETFDVLNLNLQTSQFQIVDGVGNIIDLTIISFDADTSILVVETDEGDSGFIVFKLSTGDGLFLGEDNLNNTYNIGQVETEPNLTQFKYAKSVVGNVSYEHGIIVITTSVGIETEMANFQLEYKGTNTIYENEYYIIVGEDEFNVSTNPTAIVEIGGSITTASVFDFSSISTNPNIYTQSIHIDGQKFIKKKSVLPDGTETDRNIVTTHLFPSGSRYLGQVLTASLAVTGSGGFGDYEISSSIDQTGSYLAPFITTIGLYDDNMDMVAVAKLGKPIKSLPDFPVNFIVRIDT
jgi:hypothetical protein